MNKKTLRLLYPTLVLLLIVSVLAVSTYAWFTSNQKVFTTTITSKTGGNNVSFKIGSSVDNLGIDEEYTIENSNLDQDFELMPVTTYDLNHFLIMENDGSNITYQEVYDDEKVYYHGKFYFKVETEDDENLSYYLDQRTSKFFQTDSSGISGSNEILNASRFALIINEVGQNQKQGEILKVSNTNNTAGFTQSNTILNNQTVGDGYVITYDENNNLIAKELILKNLDDCALSDTNTVLNTTYKYNVKSNTVYEANIYFYLEGTDKNCNNSIGAEGLYMGINLMGVIE